MHTRFAATLVSLTVALSAVASPVARAGGYPVIPGDNGSCQKMGELCGTTRGEDVQAIVARGGEFNVSAECTMSAVCQQMFYNGTVDDWIETYFGARSDDSQPDGAGSYSRNATRLPENVSRNISCGHALIPLRLVV